MKKVKSKRGRLSRALIVLFIVSIFFSVIGIVVIGTADDLDDVRRESGKNNANNNNSANIAYGGSNDASGSLDSSQVSDGGSSSRGGSPDSNGSSGSAQYYLTTTINLEGSGTYTHHSNTSVTVGDDVTLNATENEGYTFVGWYDGNRLLSKNTEYTFTMPAKNTSYSAHYYQIRYALDEDECYKVTGWQGDLGSGEVTIPSSYKGKPVTSIGSSAFNECTSLTSVTIPSSVTSIGGYAFDNCRSLTSITIPSSVVSIEGDTFRNCSQLTSITIPSSVTWIAPEAFFGCSALTEITIPSSVTRINSKAFSGCSALTEITIPSNVTSIEGDAFSGCSALTEITIPSSVTSIGRDAFSGCKGLISISYTGDVAGWCGISSLLGLMPNGSTRKSLYISETKVEGELVIPEGVISIPSYAFYHCSNLTSVTIPSSVTSIRENAFSGCYRIVEVYNKSTLTITKGSMGNGYVGEYAKNIYTEEGGSNLSTDESGYVIYTDGDLISLVSCARSATELMLPSGITEINSFAFYDCFALTSITIPSSVTSIEGYAFYDCFALTSITIPSSVTSIGNFAFNHCSGLNTFNYQGTKDQWRSISKGTGWNSGLGGGEYTVHCTDGDV